MRPQDPACSGVGIQQNEGGLPAQGCQQAQAANLQAFVQQPEPPLGRRARTPPLSCQTGKSKPVCETVLQTHRTDTRRLIGGFKY